MILGRDRLNLLDVEVTAVQEHGMAGVLSGLIAAGGRRTVVGHNLHSCYLYHTLPAFRELYDSADVVLMDGAPVYALWKLQGHSAAPDTSFRVGSTDWIKHLGSVQGLDRVAVVGTNGTSNALACRKLETLLPGARVSAGPARTGARRGKAASSTNCRPSPLTWFSSGWGCRCRKPSCGSAAMIFRRQCMVP